MYIVHRNLTEGLVPFATYINGKVDWLIDGKSGLFANGPENLIKEYQKVLVQNGIKHIMNIKYFYLAIRMLWLKDLKQFKSP